MSTRIGVSATATEAGRLVADGPRRDFVALAEAVGGEIVYRDEAPRRRGWRARLIGPHIRQAWRLAKAARRGDRVFADGEHVGIPLCAFLLLRMKRGVPVVMLGHYVDRRWKLAPMWLLSRVGPAATVVVHSVTQAGIARPRLGRRWTVRTVPYQVDTEFWRMPGESPTRDGIPLVVAVGAEHRDYRTLIEAVRGLDVRVCIAGASHWARDVAGYDRLPANVEFLSQPLPFAELRALYARATAVAVPLVDVSNQFGVTTILEAMSMGLPVVTTANRGQRECIRGPLIGADGELEAVAEGRGPELFGATVADAATGCYVPVGDAAALRRAIEVVTAGGGVGVAFGAAARVSAERAFSFERYVATLADILDGAAPVTARLTVTA